MKILSLAKKFFDVFKRYFIKIPHALHTAKTIFIDDKKTYLIIGDHVGDLIITMGYCLSFKEAHRIDQLVICTTPKMQGIVSKYKDSDDLILALDRRTLEELFYLAKSNITAQWVVKKGNIWLADPIGYGTPMIGFDQYLAFFPNITFRHFIKYGCLHLPETAQYQPLPLSEKAVASTKRRSIVFAPFCQNHWWNSKFPSELFLQLSRELDRYNIDLYTNIGPMDQDDKTLPGTKPLKLTFDELGKWISPDDIVIGVRSGLMDYLAYFKCHIICLYAPVSWFISFYSLDILLEKRCDYIEHVITGQTEVDAQNIMISVCKFLDMGS